MKIEEDKSERLNLFCESTQYNTMNGFPYSLLKPKVEVIESSEEEEPEEEEPEERNRREQEAALLALLEHRTNEVDHLRQRITYYKSQLDEAEKKVEETQSSLARLRRQPPAMASNTLRNCVAGLKAERSPIKGMEGSSQNHTIKSAGDNIKLPTRPPSSFHKNGVSSQNQTQSKPQLLIPAVAHNFPQPERMKESVNKLSGDSASFPTASTPTHVNSIVKVKGEKAPISVKQEVVGTQPKRAKRKHEDREHKDLIPLINSCSSSLIVNCQTGCFLPSQHKRKLRSLVLCPTDDQLFVTSALDGVVNLWQVQGGGSNANLLSSTDCQSDKQRKWPEDIAWHPHGNKLFSVYSADGQESQISILNLNKGKEKTRLRFLEDKPHVKGIINNIMFMPWEDTSFVTGGSDHAVVLWTNKDGGDSWRSQSLHRSNHSSAVMGVAGLLHKKVVMSVGADKRIIGFELETGRTDYRHQIDNKCMSILPNPRDFNLVMVQTATPEMQLRLFDIRMRQMEIHSFGWKQESSESQSALINQSWSPDGLYITSGSADPLFHIFDIRYNAHKPSQSIRAHQRRVFKAAWHHSLPLLISISSDLNIGLHTVTK